MKKHTERGIVSVMYGDYQDHFLQCVIKLIDLDTERHYEDLINAAKDINRRFPESKLEAKKCLDNHISKALETFMAEGHYFGPSIDDVRFWGFWPKPENFDNLL